jgi:hypothetical protein
MELASSPRGVARYSPRAVTAESNIERRLARKFGIERIDVLDHEPIRRAIQWVSPLTLVVPLQMKLNVVASDTSILGLNRIVLEGQVESQMLVEAN